MVKVFRESTQFFNVSIYCPKQEHLCIKKLYSIYGFYTTDKIEYISN